MSARWRIEFLDVARREFLDLPRDQRAEFLRIASLVEEHGPMRLREPHVKHLEGKLWEVRMRGRDGISRALYVLAYERRVVVVRVIVKKTQKTPRRDIVLALARAPAVEDEP